MTELTIAAETVKKSWPSAIVYWNEMWGPVVQNATWKNAASALAKVPEAIDWISLDYYRTTPSAWQTPEQEYAAQVYPKMAPHQRALQVPQVSGPVHHRALLLSSRLPPRLSPRERSALSSGVRAQARPLRRHLLHERKPEGVL